MSGLRTRVDLPVWEDCVHLWLYERSPDGVTSVAASITFEKIERHAPVTQEPIRLDRIAAQELMDQLWSVGLRPTEGKGSAGSLAATERHLEDMRALVFKTPPKQK
jgi:hypothetical protein